MKKAWVTVRCPSCGGYGMVSVWEGVAECPECGGGGLFWISENDRVADYPGGPFRGSWPKAFHDGCKERIRYLQDCWDMTERRSAALELALHDLCEQVATGEIVQPLGFEDGEDLFQKVYEKAKREVT